MSILSSSTSKIISSSPTLVLRRPFNRRVLVILAVALLLAQVAILPYQLTMQGTSLNELAAQLGPTELALVLSSELGLNWLVYCILAAIGLWLAGRTGLGLPLLEGWTHGVPVRGRLREMLPIGLGVGILVSVLGIVIPTAIKPLLPSASPSQPFLTPPAWQGLLASLSAGVTEEVLLRLFVMTLLAWVGSWISRRPDGRPTIATIMVANVLAALLFGAAHLPTQAAFTPLTPIVVAAVLLVNGLGGVFFGWMYSSRGLESAMVSHASADIVVHVLVPLVSSL